MLRKSHKTACIQSLAHKRLTSFFECFGVDSSHKVKLLHARDRLVWEMMLVILGDSVYFLRLGWFGLDFFRFLFLVDLGLDLHDIFCGAVGFVF